MSVWILDNKKNEVHIDEFDQLPEVMLGAKKHEDYVVFVGGKRKGVAVFLPHIDMDSGKITFRTNYTPDGQHVHVAGYFELQEG
jgi:hypothetical protein